MCGIVQLEMINVLLALKVYRHLWHKKQICIKCDNMAVVQVINHGSTKDPFLATCARNIWMCCAHFDIELHCIHIPGKKNIVADVLSRWQNSQQHKEILYAHIVNPIWVPTDPTMLHMNYEI